MMLSFVSQMIAMAGGGKTAVERMQYVPAGVQDGELYAHNGFIWGKVDLPDMVWIDVEETKKARLADTQFKVYLKKFQELTSGDVEDVADVSEDAEVEEVEDAPKTKAKKEAEPISDCDAEVLIDIKEAIEEGALDDAKEIMKELTSAEAIATADALIAGAEKGDDGDVDEDLLYELYELIEDIGDGVWTDDDITEAEAIIGDIEGDEVKAKAEKLFKDATELVDDLTEEEAIEEIKLAIADGDKEEATELLKFIKDERQNRRYARKVKGL